MRNYFYDFFLPVDRSRAMVPLAGSLYEGKGQYFFKCFERTNKEWKFDASGEKELNCRN